MTVRGPASHLVAPTTCGCEVEFEMPTEPEGVFWRTVGECPHQTWRLTITLMAEPGDRYPGVEMVA